MGPQAAPQAPQPVRIPKSHITLRLPNESWQLAVADSTKGMSIFKREPVTDAQGRQIIPAIMVFVENAKEYKGDVVMFSIDKRAPFMKHGLHVDTTLFYSNKDYPLKNKNALFMKASYEQEGVRHLMYMIHLIDRHDEGVQIYLDMTSDLGKQYDDELMSTVRSITEI